MLAFLVCGLTLLFTPNALSLKCQSCGPGDAPCDGPNVTSINCGAFADRCMTVTKIMNLTIEGPQTVIMKNCSHSTMICQEDGAGYPCKPNGTKCRVNCCEGDMCNQGSSEVVAPTATATMPAAFSDVSTNVSLSSNTTTTAPEGNEPPSAGVPEFSAVFGSICLGFMAAFLATLG